MISQAVDKAGPDPDYAGAFKILTDDVCSTANSFAGPRSGLSRWRSTYSEQKSRMAAASPKPLLVANTASQTAPEAPINRELNLKMGPELGTGGFCLLTFGFQQRLQDQTMAEKVDPTPKNNHLIRNKNIMLPKYKSHICSHIALKRYCCCILAQIIFRSEGQGY